MEDQRIFKKFQWIKDQAAPGSHIFYSLSGYFH